MKKTIISIFCLICVAQIQASIYDSASGLYFQRVEGTADQVEVTPDPSYKNKTSVVVPSSITDSENTYTVVSVGGGAFANCVNLETVSLPESIRLIWKAAFMNCEGLMNINIPEGVTVLGNGAFKGCIRLGLVPLQLPNSLESIEANAFEDCLFLNSLTLPSKVRHIGEAAFKGSGIYTADTYWKNDVLYIGTSLICAKPGIYGDYTVENGTTLVADAAFDGCGNLWSVYFPSSEPPYLGNDFLPGSAAFYVPCGAEETYKAVNDSAYKKVVQTVPSPFVVIGKAADPEMGRVTVGKSNACVNVDTLKAISYSGYLFLQWSDGNTENPRTVALTQDTITLTAEFEKGCLLIVEPNSTDRGSTKGDTTAHLNDIVIISATAKDGYIFKQWSDGVTDNPRSIQLTQDTTSLVAIFAVAHKVTFVDYDKTVLSIDTVADGDAATAPTNPERYGYDFIGWDKNFQSVTDDMTVTALYTPWSEGIDNTDSEPKNAEKTVCDGQIFILRGEKTYTLQGQEVK